MSLGQSASYPLARALPANAQSPDWSDVEPRTTEPTGDGIFTAGLGGATGPQSILILPYCAGSPQSTFTMRLWAWRHFGATGDAANVIWLPILVAELECIAGQAQGLWSRLLTPTEFLADTITLASPAVLGPYDRIHSPANGTIGFVRLDPEGAQKIQFDFKAGSGSGNALWARASSY